MLWKEKGGKVTYEQAKAVEPGEDGKVCCRGKPDLEVQYAAAHLGPLELFVMFDDGAAWSVFLTPERVPGQLT